MSRFGATFLVTAEAVSGIGFSMVDECETVQPVLTELKPNRSPAKRVEDKKSTERMNGPRDFHVETVNAPL